MGSSFCVGKVMNYKKIIISILATAMLVCTGAAQAAPIDSIRTSVSSARVRVVLDSKEPISFNTDKNKLQLVVTLTESSAKRQQLQVKDTVVKGINLQPAGTKPLSL